MHTEHLQNVGIGRVVAGWLIAIAVTSLAGLALISIGMISQDGDDPGSLLGFVIVALGFFAGGFFAGFRAIKAPILHAVGITVVSLSAVFLLNLATRILTFASTAAHYELAGPGTDVSALFVQLVAAIIGALLGYNVALRGKPGLGEHEPIDT